MSGTTKGLQLCSLIKKSGELELSLAEVPISEPGPDQVLVKVEATPINPSDLGLLLGPADMSGGWRATHVFQNDCASRSERVTSPSRT